MFVTLRPVLGIALVVGAARFVLTVAGAPRWAVYLASLSAVELLGSVYFAWRLSRSRDFGYLRLWAGNLVLFGVCQLLYILGLIYTGVSGRPTLYHESQRLIDFLGYDPSIPAHIGMHVLNWMLIAPTLLTWVVEAPIAWWLRRRAVRLAG